MDIHNTVKYRVLLCHHLTLFIFSQRTLYQRFEADRHIQGDPTAPGEENVIANEGRKVSSVQRKSTVAPGKRKSGAVSVVIPPSVMVDEALPVAADFSALSVALCIAIAHSRNPPVPLYAFVTELANEINVKRMDQNGITDSTQNYGRMPLPIMTVLNGPGSGYRFLSGKCRCVREVLLIPKPDLNPTQICEKLFQVKSNMDRLLMEKPFPQPPQMICENGAPGLIMDKPEQGLDLVIECLDQQQLRTDFVLGLHLVSQSLFDQVKGKYEPLTGIMKSPVELSTFYGELLTRYPDIRLLIDPFRKEDKHCWNSLSELVGDRVLLATSNWPHITGIATASEHNPQSTNRARPSSSFEKVIDSSGPGIRELAMQRSSIELQKRTKNVTASDNTLCVPVEQSEVVETAESPLTYSAWVFNAETNLDCFLVTEVIQAQQNMSGRNIRCIYSMDNTKSTELWPVELAVGMGVSFMKIGGLFGAERVEKLTHWLSIAEGQHPMTSAAHLSKYSRPILYDWENTLLQNEMKNQ
ncbi:hypothetical protein PHET_02365 [Paragonimus heterotremus]|uniref:phosphopyruvate hydratase n=1 Tax=Paragonimus heterotremus TaxID=100268 RepID=A0A8J4TG08_9TREM|nr:hypothetical protein PHET_02365 [Paragonimus heterotremus]